MVVNQINTCWFIWTRGRGPKIQNPAASCEPRSGAANPLGEGSEPRKNWLLTPAKMARLKCLTPKNKQLNKKNLYVLHF